MKILIKEQEIIIKPDEVKGTFFEALTSSNMNTDLDLEAYYAYNSYIYNNDISDIVDKYCLDIDKYVYNCLRNVFLVSKRFDGNFIDMVIKYNDLYIIELLIPLINLNKNIVEFIINSKKYININIQDTCGYTPLHFCSKYELSDFVLKLIETDNCDYNIQNHYGDTPLHICCDNNVDNCVLKLIETGKCDYNIQNSIGCTPLHYCCYNNMNDCVLKLIETGKCDYNLQNIYGNTPLHICCINKMNDCVLKLIETDKCDYNIQNNVGNTSYDLAFKEIKNLFNI
jgi:hypothetical protein